MWLTAALALLLVIFIIPQTRLLIAIPIALVVAPFVLRSRQRLPKNWRIQSIDPDDPRLTEPLRAALSRNLDSALAAGLTHHGLWLLDPWVGKRKLFFRMFSHAESGSTGSLAAVSVMENVIRWVQFSTEHAGEEAGDEQLLTTSQTTRRLALRPTTRTFQLPSLIDIAWIWQAHAARLVRWPSTGAARPLPQSREAWIDYFNSEYDDELARLIEHRVVRPTADGHIFTWRAAIQTTIDDLPPWKPRRLAALKKQEESLMADLGLSTLLAQARSEPEAQAVAPSAKIQTAFRIADDRGVPRTIARPSQLTGDERSADPRFRAVLEHAAGARRAVLRRSGFLGAILCIAAIIILHRVFGVNLITAWLATIVGTIFLMAILNMSRAAKGEQAAADVYIRRGLCPSCLYSMANLTPDTDGCLKCPECGAAWKHVRIKQFIQFSVGQTDALSEARRVGAAVTAAFGASAAGKDGKDDRRRHCRLVPPRLAGEIELAQGEHREALLAARRRIGRSGRVLRILVAIILLFVFVGLPGWIYIVKMRLIGGPALLMFVAMSTGVLLAYGVVRGNFGYSRRVIKRSMLNAGLCPSCAEPLPDAAGAEPDGCTVCTCGAAWRRLNVLQPQASTT